MEYIIALLLSLLGGAFGINKLKNRKVAIFLCFIPIFLISMLREGIGTDYYNYANILVGLKYDVPALYGWRKPEPLFLLLCETIIDLGLDCQWLFVITSLIYCLIIIYVIYSISPNPYMSLFLLFGTTQYFASLNEIRQHLGCALLFLSLKFVYEKKLKYFVIIVILAGLIHTSCFLFLFVYLFNYIRITPRKAVGIVLTIILGLEILVGVAYSIIEKTEYSGYLSESVVSSGTIGIIIQVIILLLVSLLYQNTHQYRVFYTINLVCFAVTFLQGKVPLIYRAKWMFYYPIIILLPMAIAKINDTKLRWLCNTILVVCFAVYAYVTIVINEGHGVYPYNWILN